MKKILFLLLVVLGSVAAANAQKSTFRMEDTQARLLDVMTKAYVKPLVVEVVVDESKGRITDTLFLTNARATVEMGGDLDNIRSWAVYMSSQKHNADVIVAATFNVKTNDDATGFLITIVGFPANFNGWRTADESDYEWIRMEKTYTTDTRDKIAASIK